MGTTAKHLEIIDMGSTHYSKEFKEEALNLYKNGHSAKKVAKIMQCSVSPVERWTKAAGIRRNRVEAVVNRRIINDICLRKDGAIEIILTNKIKNERARTIIDANEYGKICQYRWYFSAGRVAMSNVDGKKTLMHRFLMDAPFGREVDHINRNSLDNRRKNLRLVTRAENLQNISSSGIKNSSSKYRGVTWSATHNSWIASASIDKKRHHIGCFDAEIEAGIAAAKWRKKNMPYTVETLV